MGCSSSRGEHSPKTKESREIAGPEETGVISENAINRGDQEDMGICASQPLTPRGRSPQPETILRPSAKAAQGASPVPFARPAGPGESEIEAVKITYHMTAQGVVQTMAAAPVPAQPASPEPPRIPTIFAAAQDLRGSHDNLEIGGAVPVSFFTSGFNTQPWVLKNAAARKSLGLEN